MRIIATGEFVMKGIKSKSLRASSGQGLAEGVAGLVIFCMVFIGCLMLFINTVVLSDYYRKLQMAATEAAKSIDAEKYWIGMHRPDYNQSTAEANARNLADFILVSSGLPKTSSFKVDYPQQASNIAGQGTMQLTRVTLSVNQLRTVGGLFAPFIALSGAGISTNASSHCYAYADLAIRNQNRTAIRQFYFPVYGVNSCNTAGQVLTPFPGCGVSPGDKVWNPSLSVDVLEQWQPTINQPPSFATAGRW